MDSSEPKYLKYVWKDAAMRLRKVGIKSSLLDSRLLLQEVIKISYEELLVSATRVITEDEILEFETLLFRRLKREPVSKILKRKDFWKYRFKTTENTLDPRPETETLIEAVLAEHKDSQRVLRILDLGTGTGALILTLLSEYPLATGLGVDISLEALKVASENAISLGVNERVEFIKSDWMNNVEGKFDIIVSNPPYIKTKAIESLSDEVRLYDPKLALDGGENGLKCYNDILEKIAGVMDTHAKCYFEIGQWQENDVTDLIRKNGFEVHEIKKDLLGIPRIIVFNRPYLKLIKTDKN